MTKNTASQKVGAQLVSATDGSAFTSSVTVEVTVDAGTQATGSVGSGACTHEGNGYHTYAPAQAETNGDLLAFTFHGTGAVPVTVQVFTTGYAKSLANVPANVAQLLGTAWLTPGTAGTPDVNVKLWNALATVALPLVPATAGRTLVVDAAGLADANMVKMGPSAAGTAQTARDIGASVLLSSGTGTGQISLSSGLVKVLSGVRKNTAVAGFPFMMTTTDVEGVSTPATGKTVACTRSIDGGAFGAGTLANVGVEIGNGWYTVDFAAGDLNGNFIILRATASGCDDGGAQIVTFG